MEVKHDDSKAKYEDYQQQLSTLLIAEWTAPYLVFHICSPLIKAIKIEEKTKNEREIEKTYRSQQATSLFFDTNTKFTPWFRFLISSIIFKAHLCSALIFVRAEVVTTKQLFEFFNI